MTIIFFEQKYAALTLATKIFKNQEYHLFLPKGMQHTALVGKTIWLEAGGDLACTPRNEPTHEVCRGAVESTTNKSAS